MHPENSALLSIREKFLLHFEDTIKKAAYFSENLYGNAYMIKPYIFTS